MKTFIDFETKIVKLLTNEVSNVTITFKSDKIGIELSDGTLYIITLVTDCITSFDVIDNTITPNYYNRKLVKYFMNDKRAKTFCAIIRKTVIELYENFYTN